MEPNSCACVDCPVHDGDGDCSCPGDCSCSLCHPLADETEDDDVEE